MTQFPGSQPPGPSPYPAGHGPGTGSSHPGPASTPGAVPGYGYGPAGQPLPYATTSPGPSPVPSGPGGDASSRSLRGPVVLLVAGILLLLLGAALFLYASLRPVASAASLSQLSTGYEMQAKLEGNTTYGLYYDDSGSTPSCRVASPHDDDVSVSTNITGTVTVNNHTLFATFVTNEAGDYTITCTSSTEQEVYIGLTTSVSDVFRLIGGVLVAQVVTALIGTAGLVMAVGGLIWLTRRRSSRSSQPPATTPAAAAPPVAAQPGTYAHTQTASTGYAAHTAPGQGYSLPPGTSSGRAVPTSSPTSPATDAQQPPAGASPTASPPAQGTGSYYGRYQGGHGQGGWSRG
ncbi:hypothetical protein [Actinomyces wuliandei]|uniref:hypothetical protein n=1 Tax=Actinomyces wuliandei TaxID=2057743 RepID=UPI000FD9EE9B|nr:hypothetical protein [Actinomyces wuliandei]